MDIEVEKLRNIANQLLDYLTETGNQRIIISHDYYWFIPKCAVYDPYSQPNELTLGQLSDDLSELLQIGDGQSEPVAYALVWLSSILRAVGEEVIA